MAPFSARDPHRVVFSGTLTVKKGIVELIRAWCEVRRRCDQAELHVYGKDNVAPEGGSMISFLKDCLGPRLAESVRFHGHVSRAVLASALSAARAAVFPSFAEGFAWAPLEAMAHGCPTIYSQLGSGPELLVDGRDGLLVDPHQPAGIADAVCRVLADGELARRLSVAGRARVLSTFALDVLLPSNEAFYAKLLDSFRSPKVAQGEHLVQSETS